MGDIDQEVASEVSCLQANITATLGELEGFSEDDPRYEALFARLVSASSALLEYEADIPNKLEQPQRQASRTVLTWSAGAHLAEAVVIALAPFFTGITWWWLVAAVAQVVVGLAVLTTSGPVFSNDMAFAEEAEAPSLLALVGGGVVNADAELGAQFLETQSYSHTL